MKTIIKYQTKEVVKEVEREIELPAYFIVDGATKKNPSDFNDEDFYQCHIVKLSEPKKHGIAITLKRDDIIKPEPVIHTLSTTFWGIEHVLTDGRQVDEREWEKAKELLINQIKEL